ncbi:TPA: hypothetical protein ND687_004137 [Escherichia coli]|uniref:hypothetical protein n=1 Tax=Escherichia coli TaxID=562 RepID=UPI000F52ABA2|nr:hypothetical protein [Escherichia coli]EEZ0291195.1 hypothetical protein [Escherichia coli]MDS1520670.1 hypothetical protein [Escherichia coli]MEB7170071.1 hypothetical protein [Escherichia coli]HCD8091949.1 hypothetical protein [Escherichia coli]
MKRYLDIVYIAATALLFIFCYFSFIEVNKLTPSLKPVATVNGEYNVEYCKIDKNSILVKGWAAPKGGDKRIKINVFVTDNAGNVFLIKNKKLQRKDIAKIKNAPGLYESSGFVASTANGTSNNLTNKIIIESISYKGVTVAEHECK